MGDNNNKIETKKLPRTPMYQANVLSAVERPGFVRRIFNDEPGRVAMAERGGYQIVQGDAFNHTISTQTETQDGSVCRRVVNKRPGAPSTHGVLMEIPVELYEEDQKAKQAVRREKEEQINPEKQVQPGSHYGKLTKN